MRSGGCGLPQTLTAEAASVLKHSLGLARRRGHAQVTPLHVAATLLTLRSSSLRRACLKSHSSSSSSHSPPSLHHHHPPPLHCRALELCFNVALNRLPTSPPPSFLHPHQPSLSNALVAALKRAQAHHRRGCTEQQQQQQPLLTTIKVELEQLIISILDDPSVSRVMREAGFSSTAVKNNLDDSSSASSVFQCYNTSGGVYSSPCSPSPPTTSTEVPYSFDHCNIINPVLFSPPSLKRAPPPPLVFSCNYNEDVKLVLDVLLRKKRKNTVIVGDSVSFTEGLVGELMGRFERGEVPDELKSTRFIKFQFPSCSSLSFMKREQVEMSLLQLERKADSVGSLRGGGVIVYIGDLKWTVGDSNLSEKEKGLFSPVEHLVSEIGKLFCDYGSSSKAGSNNNNKVWLMGTASYQTYMRCQMRQPSLETQWSLQAVPVPSSNGLDLSLHASSVLDSKPFFNDKEEQDKLTCCAECSSSYEKEAQMFKPGQKNLLPSWLQSHNTEAHHHKDELAQLRRKWNRLCHCLHQNKHFQSQWGNTIYSNHSSNAKIYPYSSSYPWWPNQGGSNSINTTESSSTCFGDSTVKHSYSTSNLVPRFRRQQSCTIEFNFGNENQKQKNETEPSLDTLKGMESKEVKITLALGNSSFSDSGQTVENITDHATTLRRAHICKLLQEDVPWQSETLVSSIAEAIFVDSKSAKEKNTCWLYLQGNDSTGKRRLARAIAESLFGSAHFLFNMDMRKKETLSSSCTEMLNKALKTREQVVVLIENADSADAQFRKFLADGYETGKFGDFSSKESPGQRIIILTKNDSRKEQYQEDSVISLVLKAITETQPGSDNKRKADWDLLTKLKRPRKEDKEEVVLVSEQKKDFSRQSSFNTLDLNIRAEEEDGDDDGEDKAGGSSPISRDSQANVLLESIENRFVLNKNPGEDKRDIEAMFSSKIKRYFEEVCGKQRLEKFSVDERVIEEMRVGCGSFTNSLFEKWLKDIFQSSLEGINMRGKEEGVGGILFKLCWGGKGDRILDSGFMSSCLPRNIQVSYSKD